jgi:NAD-dependent SIR2 family protein deacetylase
MHGKCSSCECTKSVRVVTIRMYEKRNQTDWRVRVCENCVRGFRVFMDGFSIGRQDSYFSPNVMREGIVEFNSR